MNSNKQKGDLIACIMAALIQSTLGADSSPFDDLEEVLSGKRQKGKPVSQEDALFKAIISLLSKDWSSAPDHVKEEARAAIKEGDLSPNCDDAECEFCTWIRNTDEWKKKEVEKQAAELNNKGTASAEEFTPFLDPTPERPANVPDFLRAAANTYSERNPLYGDAYKSYGPIMMGLFPQGLYIGEPDDWNRFGVFSMIVSKMARYAANLADGGHADSALDLTVYSAMLAELTEVK